MEVSQLLGYFASVAFTDLLFKVAMIFLAVLYLLYAVVIAKQVKIMDKSLEAPFNQFIFFVCSIQTTVALIMVIFSIFIN